MQSGLVTGNVNLSEASCSVTQVSTHAHLHHHLELLQLDNIGLCVIPNIFGYKLMFSIQQLPHIQHKNVVFDLVRPLPVSVRSLGNWVTHAGEV